MRNKLRIKNSEMRFSAGAFERYGPKRGYCGAVQFDSKIFKNGVYCKKFNPTKKRQKAATKSINF